LTNFVKYSVLSMASINFYQVIILDYFGLVIKICTP
jgi:hypothetical protein